MFRMALLVVQIVLAMGSVAAFASLELGLSHPHDPSYLITNLVCSTGLAVIAAITLQPGFVITNVLWVVISASGLMMLARRRRNT
jgi:hypothetical protein